ncbi:MAG: hypothetical protein ACXWQE_12525 [Bdellovibrionales bacterium]
MKNLIVLATLLAISFSALAAEKATKRKSSSPAVESSDPHEAVRWNDLEQSNHSVVGYLGIYNIGLYPLPVVIGADFRMLLPNPEWALRAGFLYWSASGWARAGGTATLFDLNVGAGHVWTIKRVEIEGGGRLGYDMFKVSNDFVGWDVFGKSGNTLVFGPYAAGTFKFTSEWSAGVEFRLPYYLNGGGLLLNQPYILAQGQYHF